VTFCTAALVRLIAQGAANVPQLLSWRPLVTVGEYSYTLYALHWPLLLLMGEEFYVPGRAKVMAAAYLVVLAGLAFVVRKVFENPMRKLIMDATHPAGRPVLLSRTSAHVQSGRERGLG